MSELGSFLQELEEAVTRGTPESRKRALWHTTDVMIAGRYSDDEIWTFGAVIGRLADEIEVAARAQLARQLARFDRAPMTIEGELIAKSTGTTSEFKLDDRVFHQKFGYGQVVRIDGNKLTIAFEKAGEKKVVDSFVERA